MAFRYWSQFDKNEIDEMHAVVSYEYLDNFQEDEDVNEDFFEDGGSSKCPRCSHVIGCNYCLMVC